MGQTQRLKKDERSTCILNFVQTLKAHFSCGLNLGGKREFLLFSASIFFSGNNQEQSFVKELMTFRTTLEEQLTGEVIATLTMNTGL